MKLIKKTTIPTERIHEWLKNPRAVRPSDIKRLKSQLQRLGQFRNLLCVQNQQAPACAHRDDVPEEDYIVIDGNQRLKAMRDMGFRNIQITVIHCQSEAELIELSLAANDHAGAYDDQNLATLLDPFSAEIPLELYRADTQPGVSLQTILETYTPDTESLEDKLPEPEEEEPWVKLGDLFQIGDHRLLCGDATDPQHLKALLQNQLADAVFTDPPYNVAYKGSHFKKVIMGDKQEASQYLEFCDRFMLLIAQALRPGGTFYICSGYSSYPAILAAIHHAGLIFSNPIIWVKDYTSRGWQDYRRRHEMLLRGRRSRSRKAIPILYGWRHGAEHYFKDTREEADVWQLQRRAPTTMLHPTQKPIALIARAIQNSTRHQDLVLDPFAGSGSTLIAAQKTGRRSALCDLDPQWVQTTIRRACSYMQIPIEKIKESKINILNPINTNPKSYTKPTITNNQEHSYNIYNKALNKEHSYNTNNNPSSLSNNKLYTKNIATYPPKKTSKKTKKNNSKNHITTKD